MNRDRSSLVSPSFEAPMASEGLARPELPPVAVRSVDALVTTPRALDSEMDPREDRRERSRSERQAAYASAIDLPMMRATNGPSASTAPSPTSGPSASVMQALEQTLLRESFQLRLSGQNYFRTELTTAQGTSIGVVLRVVNQQVTVRLSGVDADLRRQIERGWERLSGKAARQGVQLRDLEFLSPASASEPREPATEPSPQPLPAYVRW